MLLKTFLAYVTGEKVILGNLATQAKRKAQDLKNINNKFTLRFNKPTLEHKYIYKFDKRYEKNLHAVLTHVKSASV